MLPLTQNTPGRATRMHTSVHLHMHHRSPEPASSARPCTRRRLGDATSALKHYLPMQSGSIADFAECCLLLGLAAAASGTSRPPAAGTADLTLMLGNPDGQGHSVSASGGSLSRLALGLHAAAGRLVGTATAGQRRPGAAEAGQLCGRVRQSNGRLGREAQRQRALRLLQKLLPQPALNASQVRHVLLHCSAMRDSSTICFVHSGGHLHNTRRSRTCSRAWLPSPGRAPVRLQQQRAQGVQAAQHLWGRPDAGANIRCRVGHDARSMAPQLRSHTLKALRQHRLLLRQRLLHDSGARCRALPGRTCSLHGGLGREHTCACSAMHTTAWESCLCV